MDALDKFETLVSRAQLAVAIFGPEEGEKASDFELIALEPASVESLRSARAGRNDFLAVGVIIDGRNDGAFARPVAPGMGKVLGQAALQYFLAKLSPYLPCSIDKPILH